MIIVTKLLQSRNIRVSYCLINICTKFTVYTVYRHSMNVDYPKIKISIGRWNEVEEIKFLLYIQRYTLFFFVLFSVLLCFVFFTDTLFLQRAWQHILSVRQSWHSQSHDMLRFDLFLFCNTSHNSPAMQKLLQRLEAFSPPYDPQFRFDFENSELIKQRTTINHAR